MPEGRAKGNLGGEIETRPTDKCPSKDQERFYHLRHSG